MDRRKFIAASAATVAASVAAASPIRFLQQPAIKAIAFDAFPIFDPRPVFALVDNLYPDKGKELTNVWRTKQFEYCFLRTAAGQYKNFEQVTEDALVFAANRTGITLSAENKTQLLQQYQQLGVWPDVLPALDALMQKGIRLCFLSNMSPGMLSSCMKHAKVEHYFEQAISTDQAKTYKPSAAGYRLGMEQLKLKKEEILFAAFAGWDASGAKWFGYPTFWVNRMDLPKEELDTTPDGMGKGMVDLVNFLK